MKHVVKVWVLALMVLSMPVLAGGLSEGWKQLGKEKVKFNMERDEIRAASKGFVKQIVIEVRGSAVYFESVAVHLSRGDVIDLPIRSIIRAGERSRVFDLPGEARVIRKVVFDYKRIKESSGNAEVILWGRK